MARRKKRTHMLGGSKKATRGLRRKGGQKGFGLKHEGHTVSRKHGRKASRKSQRR